MRALTLYERELGTTKFDDDEQIWMFRNRVILVFQPSTASSDEIVTAVKHVVLSQESSFEEMKRDIERLEQYKKGTQTPRESIHREVRVFVWRRDYGKNIPPDRSHTGVTRCL